MYGANAQVPFDKRVTLHIRFVDFSKLTPEEKLDMMAAMCECSDTEREEERGAHPVTPEEYYR